MGPLFFRAENTRRVTASPSGFSRFNGAALFQSGERWPGTVRRSTGFCFNGAALFQSGERPYRALRARNIRPLQWGRSFSERRTTRPPTRPARVPAPCFNGAALFQSGELKRERLPRLLTFHASMGPLFFRAENEPRRGQACRQRTCFNGAALFQSGEPRTRWRWGTR